MKALHENFEKYRITEARLCDDISNDKLTFYEALARCHELWDLIPNDTDINFVRLKNLMKEKFGGLDEYKKHYSKTYAIDIGSIKDIDIEDYTKKVNEKYLNVDLGNDYICRFHDKYGITNSGENFIPISSTIDEQLNDVENFNCIMTNVKQDNLTKHHAIEFAEWLWRNAIAYQKGETYIFREDDGKVCTYTIEESYHKYLSKSIPEIRKSKKEIIKELKEIIPPPRLLKRI